MIELEKTINEAFNEAYPNSSPVADEEALCKRVKILTEDLMCTRVNFRVTNKAYADLMRKVHGIRNHWWQFWRTPAK